MNLRQAAEMALEALEDIFGKEKKDVGAINALRQALTPEVAWAPEPSGYLRAIRKTARPIQMHRMGLTVTPVIVLIGYVCECEGWEPPKREWVGLTEEDFYKKARSLYMKFAEARLKEKNT
jgi:hypothetical protein